MKYTTRGTCSRFIDFDVIDGKVTNVKFTMGCHGNTQGVAKLVEGMDIHEVIGKLKESIVMGEEHHVRTSLQSL